MIPQEPRNAFWAGLEAAAGGGFSCASAFLMARLIGPGEFGIGAAAVALHVMLWVGVNALFADALVQQADVDDRMAASASRAAVAVGALAAAIQIGAGWLIAAAMSDRRLIAMSLLLALPLPLVGAGGVAQGLLTRRRAYRTLAARAVVGQGLGTAVGLAAALCGFGAVAPVAQQFVASVAGALILLAHAGAWPARRGDSDALRALLRIGLPLTASTVLLAARYRLFALLLGGTAGAAALGETHMAFRLVDTVRELCSTAMWRLMLPVLAEHQHDPPTLLVAVDRLLRRSAAVTLPLCGGMAIGLPPLIRVLLGPSWTPSATAAEPLIVLMAALCLMFPGGVAVVARGHTARALCGSAASVIATLAGVAWLHPDTALRAVLVWCGAQGLLAPYALWIAGRATGTGPLRPLQAGLPMVAVTIAALTVAAFVPQPPAEPVRMPFRLTAYAAVIAAGAALVRHRPVPDAA